MSRVLDIVGHRGIPSSYPDNTLAGFVAASAVADAVELDVRRSADGLLVLAHDPRLGDLEIRSNAWSVLSTVDLGGGHRPALLDEVLAALPDTPVQMEIKNLPFDSGFEPDHRLALEAAVRARPDDVVTSFNWATVDAVRRGFPDVGTGIAIDRYGDMGGAIEHCFDVGHSVLVPEHPLVDAEAIEKAAGLRVYPYTVNDSDQAAELARLGVAGIITDDPALIARSIE